MTSSHVCALVTVIGMLLWAPWGSEEPAHAYATVSHPAVARPDSVPRSVGGPAQDGIERIRSAISEGDLDTAISAAQELVAAQPGSVQGWTWLGHAYRLAKRPADAARAYLRAQQLEPDDPEVLLGLAELQQQSGDLATAAKTLAKVTELVPTNPAGWRAAANLAMKRDEYESAAQLFKRYLQLRPDDVEAGNLRGVALYLDQQYDAAIETLEQVLSSQPDYLPAVYSLGVVLADRPADHDRALVLLRRAASGGWEPADSNYLIGRILADRGEYQQAAAAFEKALESNPDHLDANYRLAQAYARLGRRQQAATYSTRFRRLQQQFNEQEARTKKLRTLRNELLAALQKSDLTAADRVLNQMLAADPEDPATLLQAAKVWISTGNSQAATDAVVAALQIDPDNWEGLYLRGLLLQRDDHPEAALRALQLSLQSNPLFGETYAALGTVLVALGRVQDAVRAYQAAIELEPDNPGYHLNLSTVYGRLGNDELQRRELAEYRRLLNRQER